MAFMSPKIVNMTCYHVETSHGTETVPGELCDVDPADPKTWGALSDYLEGTDPTEVTKQTGYYARLSASGYSDCTDWMGPYTSYGDAMSELCDQYDCDENGDDPDEPDDEDPPGTGFCDANGDQ
jgi:hypothetical protein